MSESLESVQVLCFKVRAACFLLGLELLRNSCSEIQPCTQAPMLPTYACSSRLNIALVEDCTGLSDCTEAFSSIYALRPYSTAPKALSLGN